MQLSRFARPTFHFQPRGELLLSFLTQLILIGATALAGFATTIVALRSDRRVIVAADSQLTLTRNGTTVERSQVCKINKAGNVIFAYAGMVNYQAPVAGRGTKADFSIPASIRSVLSSDGPLSTKRRPLEAAIRSALMTIVRTIRAEAPNEFSSRVGTVVLEVLLATVETGVPELITLDFRLDLGTHGEIRLEPSVVDCPGDCPKVNGTLVAGLGYHSDIDRYLSVEHFSGIPSANWADHIVQLVQAEIIARKNDVGPPIAVLELSPTGIHWYRDMKGTCGDKLE